MNRHLSAMGAVAVAALAAVLLAPVPPAHAAVDGTLIVNVVDQYGRPAPGIGYAYDSSGMQYYDDGTVGQPVAASTHTYTVPADGYSAITMTPWSGITCAGVSPCNVLVPPTTFTPIATVTPGGTSFYTIHVTVPSITGSTAVGSPLSLQIPTGLTEMQIAYSFVLPGLGGPGTQQWVRGATDIPSATGTSYTTVPADGMQSMTARLTASPTLTYLFGTAGLVVQPFTTNAIAMAKFTPAKTKTKVTVPHSLGANEAASMKVKVTAKGKAVPDGYVTIKIGNFKVKKKLKKGSVFISLPHLGAGNHTITASYGGSDFFAKSKAKKITVTVHK